MKPTKIIKILVLEEEKLNEEAKNKTSNHLGNLVSCRLVTYFNDNSAGSVLRLFLC